MQTDSLRNLLKRATINLPSYWTFRHTLLPSVLDKVTARIESRLKSADTICLITDIWTNRNNTDFIALGASFTDKYFDRDILVISMIPMKGKHTAENIKICIEEMINQYDFDKTKIDDKFYIKLI